MQDKQYETDENVTSGETEIPISDDSLKFSELCNKLSGMIHGCLLGETYARSITKIINEDLNYWGFNTDQMLLMIKNITNSGSFNPRDYVKLLQDYFSLEGISEITALKNKSDDKLFTLDSYTKNVVFDQKSTVKPIDCSFKVCNLYQKKGYQTDHNTPLIRCAIAGLFNNWDQLSYQVCMTTHADHRCLSAGIIYTVMVHSMLSGLQTDVVKTVQETAGSIMRIGKIKDQSHIDEYIRYTSEGYINSLDLLSLDSEDSAYKTMSTSLYALKSLNKDKTKKNFYKILDELIKKGGDVATNCALAGALMGCELGYNELNINETGELCEIKEQYIMKFKEIEADFFKSIGFARTDESMSENCHNEDGWSIVIRNDTEELPHLQVNQ
jgi:hypothetical protein